MDSVDSVVLMKQMLIVLLMKRRRLQPMEVVAIDVSSADSIPH